MTLPAYEIAGLPGAEIVIAGLTDLTDSRISESALLVLIAAPNLRRQGIDVPEAKGVALPYEHRLYELLSSENNEAAYSRYNSLIRRIVSFERALAWRRRLNQS
jgi:hypothetical protein